MQWPWMQHERREPVVASWQPPEANRLLSPDAALAEIIESVTTWTGRLQLAEELTALLILATIAILVVQLVLARGGSGGGGGAGGTKSVAPHDVFETGALDGGMALAGSRDGDSAVGSAAAIDAKPAAGAAAGLLNELASTLETPGEEGVSQPIREEEDAAGPAASAKQSPAAAAARSAGDAGGHRSSGIGGSSRSPPAAAGGLAGGMVRGTATGRLSRSAVQAHAASHALAEHPAGGGGGGEHARRRSLDRAPAAPSEVSAASRLSRATYKTALANIATREAVREGMRRRPNDPFDQAVLRNTVRTRSDLHLPPPAHATQPRARRADRARWRRRSAHNVQSGRATALCCGVIPPPSLTAAIPLACPAGLPVRSCSARLTRAAAVRRRLFRRPRAAASPGGSPRLEPVVHYDWRSRASLVHRRCSAALACWLPSSVPSSPCGPSPPPAAHAPFLRPGVHQPDKIVDGALRDDTMYALRLGSFPSASTTSCTLVSPLFLRRPPP